MNRGRQTWITVVCCIITALLSGTVVAAILLPKIMLAKKENKPQISGALHTQTGETALYDSDKLLEIASTIDTYFIGTVDPDEMTDRMAEAMIEGLGDEWSYYIPADEYASYQEAVSNSYVGIGITITWENEDPRGFLITDVTPNSPAYRAGIQKGDYLAAVEGVPVSEIGMTESKNRVRGEEGTDITITITHDGVDRELTITRESIKVVNVTYELLEQGVAYIHISNFDENCAADTIEAIEQALADGAQGLIFDVRFNPGGYKRELVEVLDYLLPEGPLFRSVDYSGNESVEYSDANCLDIPMAVLVNVDSYSAAEFFAAALQEYDAAVIVGTQTYGKGYFQTVFRLSDGSAINISIGKYTTPNGVSLVGVGITPDRVVEISEETYADLYYGRLSHEDDEQLQTAIAALLELIEAR